MFSTDPYADFDNIPSPPYAKGTVDQWTHGKNTMKLFVNAAHNNNKKALLSLGGWSCSVALLYAITSGDQSDLISDIVDFIKNRIPLACGSDVLFDGIDIDLEPYANNWGKMSSAELQSLRDFYKKLKEALPAGQNMLTMAISGNSATAQNIESKCPGFLRDVNSVIDYIVMMDYDFHGSFDYPGVTDFQDALYPDTNHDDNLNISAGVEDFIKFGVTAAKMILGIPAYGRAYKIQDPSALTPLYQPFVNEIFDSPLYDNPSLDIAVQGKCGSSIVNLINLYGFKEVNHYNDSSQFVGTYAEGSKDGNRIFVSYDNVTSLEEKASYVKQVGLAGIVVYDAGGDVNNRLLNSAFESLK